MVVSDSATRQNADQLIKLIQLYKETVLELSKELSISLNLNDLTLWRSREIPVKGKFKEEGWNYYFHGSGCYISSPSLITDFEFDINCTLGGFDKWRISSFLNDNEKISSKFSEFKDDKVLDDTFNYLAKEEAIIRNNGVQESDLYFLAK